MEYWRRTEWRLGLFISGGIVLFSIFILAITNLNIFHKTYEVRVLFRYASGIDVGAPVRLAGVQVGEVKRVKIVYDPQDERPIVEVDLDINQDVRIRQNAIVLINTLGILGEKYVEILPGTKDTPLVHNGDVLIGRDSIPLAQLADLGYQIAKKLDNTIDGLREIFVSEESRESLKITLKNLRELSENFNKLVKDTDEAVIKLKEGEGTLGRFLSDPTLYNEMLELVRDIKRHPWKLLRRPRKSELEEEGNKGYIYKR